jgi:hypothetical protein
MQPAVFTKNYKAHLQAAADIAATDGSQLVTFRSSRSWSEAQRLLAKSGPGTLPVLFAVADDSPRVQYRAWLHEVVLSPRPDDPRSQELLRLRPTTTTHEDPWATNTKTLYAVSGCRKLEEPIPYRELIKLGDHLPLSDEFKYSYSLVRLPRTQEIPEPLRAACDVTAPPPRVEAVVLRIVRDTDLTRRLKALHDSCCQLCSTRLALSSTVAYSEAHHLQPLGRPHNGPDIAANVIVLCPNCHALCDRVALRIDAAKIRTVSGHLVGVEFLAYHNRLHAEGTAG